MINSLRWRLAVSFVLLSSMVCLVLACIGTWSLYTHLTNTLDQHLKVLASEYGHAIDVKDGKPYFRDWKRVVSTDPPRSLGTIQLFSSTGVLLESYGPKATPHVVAGNEVKFDGRTMRTYSTPLTWESKIVGYLQFQESTEQRDEAVRDFVIVIAELSPLLLLGLGATSFFVSGKAVAPLQENIETMRGFLADAGHELNTPLAIIRARAEALERKLLRQGVDASDVQVIANTAERATRLTNDFMLLAEVEGALATRSPAPVDLTSLVQQLVQDFSDRFAEKGIGLQLSRLDKASVTGNSDELYRAIANLLENALRYTEWGDVTISIVSNDNSCCLSVEDTGIGIPETSLPQVFDRLYRVDKSRARSSGGSGLGLAIAKAIIDSHGGTISVTSSVGVGTKFSVVLPLRSSRKASAESQSKSAKNLVSD